MNLSLRYYALSLGLKTSRLYEGYRDTLIDIQDQHFPFDAPLGLGDGKASESNSAAQITYLLRTDQRFSYYFKQDALYLVVIGKGEQLAQFEFVSAHLNEVIGKVDGDFSALSTQDLGKIVWPVVRTALAGTDARYIDELLHASVAESIVKGLDAVQQALASQVDSALFVDEDYHVRRGDSAALRPNDDEDDLMDDVVDVVIEQVLAKGGNIIFLDSASMLPFERIALIPNGAEEI